MIDEELGVVMEKETSLDLVADHTTASIISTVSSTVSLASTSRSTGDCCSRSGMKMSMSLRHELLRHGGIIDTTVDTGKS